LRTAAAARLQAVLLPPEAADPFAPKVVRSAMGAHFRLPIHSLGWAELRQYLRPAGQESRLRIYLADSSGGIPYTQADFRLPVALIVGGEAEGAGAEAQSLADGRVHIPMPGQAESLNAAVAAAILMFEVVRQRQI
jgi:TrmH family RNA methyltransferase